MGTNVNFTYINKSYNVTVAAGTRCSSVSISRESGSSGGNPLVSLKATGVAGAYFDGWYKGSTRVKTDANCSYGLEYTGTYTLTANFYLRYNITWDANGGTGGKTVSVKENTATSAPTVSRSGYTFAGWYKDGTRVGGQNVSVTATGVATYTASWTKNPVYYTVRFFDGSGNQIGSSQSVLEGQNAAAPQNPTRTGYTFTGWSPSYTNITSNTDCVAQWTVNKYTVTWNANGGSGGRTDADKDYGSTITAPTPSRTGYAFDGWFTAATGGTKLTGSSLTVSGTATYYAHWTANTYYVKFNANGGSGTMANETFTYGTAKALTANAFARTGYTFSGWATSASGSVAYSNGASVSAMTATNGATVNLYAKWTENLYTVTFDKCDSTAFPATFDSGYTGSSTGGVATSVGLPTVSASGFTFNGWYTAKSGGTKVTSSINPTANVTYYAHWTANNYTLTVKFNGGSYIGYASGERTYTLTQGKNASYSIHAPSRTGYSLTGFFTSATGGTKVYDASCKCVQGGYWTAAGSSGLYKGAQNLTVYAQWSINSYKMTAALDAASANVISSSQANLSVSGVGASDSKAQYGNSVTYSAATDGVGGYVFHGWYYEDGTRASTDASFTMTVPAKDVNLVAKYSAKVTVRQVGNSLPAGTNNLVYINGTEYATNVAEERVVLGGNVSINAYADNCAFSGWYTYVPGATGYDEYDQLPYEQNQTIRVDGDISLVAYFRDKSKTIYVVFTNKDITTSGPGFQGVTSPVASEDGLAKLVLTGEAEQIATRASFISESGVQEDYVPATGLFVKFDSVSRFSLSASQKTEGKPFYRIRRRGLKETASAFKTVCTQSVYSGIAYANSVYEIDWGVPTKIGVSVSCDQNDGEVHIVGETSWSSSGASVKVVALESVTVYANAKNGKKFVKWTSGGSTVSTSPRYTFEPSAAMNLSAVFADDDHCVMLWEGSDRFKTLHWRSKRYVMTKPINPVGARVDANGYPVTMTVDMFSAPDNNTHFPTQSSERATDSRTCSIAFGSQDARRLKSMRPERYMEVDIVSENEVDAAFVGASMGGIAT